MKQAPELRYCPRVVFATIFVEFRRPPFRGKLIPVVKPLKKVAYLSVVALSTPKAMYIAIEKIYPNFWIREIERAADEQRQIFRLQAKSI
jgi:hypothetical protein